MSLFITLTGSGILRIFVANYEISENWLGCVRFLESMGKHYHHFCIKFLFYSDCSIGQAFAAKSF